MFILVDEVLIFDHLCLDSDAPPSNSGFSRFWCPSKAMIGTNHLTLSFSLPAVVRVVRMRHLILELCEETVPDTAEVLPPTVLSSDRETEVQGWGEQVFEGNWVPGNMGMAI